MELENGKIDGDKITFQVSFGEHDISMKGRWPTAKLKSPSQCRSRRTHEYTVARADFNGEWKGEVKLPSEARNGADLQFKG